MHPEASLETDKSVKNVPKNARTATVTATLKRCDLVRGYVPLFGAPSHIHQFIVFFYDSMAIETDADSRVAQFLDVVVS